MGRIVGLTKELIAARAEAAKEATEAAEKEPAEEQSGQKEPRKSKK